MPFQAVAWAWRVPVADPIERAVVLFLANAAGVEGVADVDYRALSRFACAPPAECLAALRRLEGDGVLVRSGRDDIVVVHFPTNEMEQFADGSWGVPPNREPLLPVIRSGVLRRYGGLCFACGSDETPEVDHIIPRAVGGSNAVENLHVLCGPCNRTKRDRLGWVVFQGGRCG